jgi:hypothetical protein
MNPYITLSTTLQDVILYNHYTLLKYLFLFSMLAFSLFYVLYYKNTFERATPFYTVGLIRVIFTSTSWVLIFTTPIWILLLHPNYDFNTFYIVYMSFYAMFMGIGLILMAIDFLYYTPQIMMKFAGFDLDDPNVQKVFNWLNKYKKR